MRRERGTESDDQARAEELYEQDIRDRDRGNSGGVAASASAAEPAGPVLQRWEEL